VHLGDLVATFPGLLRGHADRCHLGLAVSDTRHAVVVDHRRVLPGDVFGDEDALGEADMGQLQARDQVTDRIDVADTGVQVLVDLHETTVERDALLLVTEPLGDRAAADGDQENFRLQDLATLEGDRDAGVGFFDRFERFTELGLDLAPPEGPLQQLGAGLVLQGKKTVEGLHEGHVRAVGTPHTGELHADHTATQDDGGTGHVVQVHGLVTGDDLLTVDLQAQGLGLSTRGEQDVTALVDSAVDGDLVLAGELALTLDHGDLAGLDQPTEAFVQAVDHFVLVFVHSVDVDAVEAGLDPDLLALLGGVGDLGRVEEGLGGDAATVQAGTAELV